MPNTLKLVATLFCVCVVCGAVLALVNDLTKDEIVKQERLREERGRMEVLAGANGTVTFDKENDLTKDEIVKQERLRKERCRMEVLAGANGTVTFDKEPVVVADGEYYIGRTSDGDVAGIVFSAETSEGYAGKIRLIVGVAPDGKSLKGVRALKHGETPGLGARISEKKPGENEPWFMIQFKGLTADGLFVKQDSPEGAVDAITAATISSRAVTNAVRMELERFTQEIMPELESSIEQTKG